MAVIEDFINRYRREYDFYDQAARLALLLEVSGELAAHPEGGVDPWTAKGSPRLRCWPLG
jgi:hypothetical protein